MMITMRAHHLLCTTEFSGHGYSEGFTAHLEQVVELLHNGEDHEVRLVDHPDLICEACPKLVFRSEEREEGLREEQKERFHEEQKEGLRKEQKRVLRYGSCSADHNRIVLKDRGVLDALHLEKERPYPFSGLLDALENNLDEDAFIGLCGNCSWYKEGLCSWESLAANASHLKRSIKGYKDF